MTDLEIIMPVQETGFTRCFVVGMLTVFRAKYADKAKPNSRWKSSMCVCVCVCVCVRIIVRKTEAVVDYLEAQIHAETELVSHTLQKCGARFCCLFPSSVFCFH